MHCGLEKDWGAGLGVTGRKRTGKVGTHRKETPTFEPREIEYLVAAKGS